MPAISFSRFAPQRRSFLKSKRYRYVRTRVKRGTAVKNRGVQIRAVIAAIDANRPTYDDRRALKYDESVEALRRFAENEGFDFHENSFDQMEGDSLQPFTGEIDRGLVEGLTQDDIGQLP